MASLRGRLRHWAKFTFGSIKLRKLALLHDLEVLDTGKETRHLSPAEFQQEEEIRKNLNEICKQEELYWKQ